MNYLIPVFDCFIYFDDLISLKANVKYKVSEISSKCGLVFDTNNQLNYLFKFEERSNNVLKVNYGFDNYYFLFKKQTNEFFTTKINYKSKEVVISLFNKLIITIDGKLICEQDVENLVYSHFEIDYGICFIFFKGERNFLVAIKDEELSFANYYDECNIAENGKMFMCKLTDALNHGLVFNVNDKETENYLVYLDDEEMNLKQEFLPFVFLDCIKAGNYKYCNQLLSNDMKMEDEKGIKDFFSEFDFYYPIDKNKFVFIK